MNMFFRVLHEAALKNGSLAINIYNSIELTDAQIKLIQEAADIYAEQKQGSINTNVVRPTSDLRDGGGLLQGEAEEKGVSDGDVKNCIIYCMDDCECTDICKMWKTARKSS